MKSKYNSFTCDVLKKLKFPIPKLYLFSKYITCIVKKKISKPHIKIKINVKKARFKKKGN